MSNTNILSNGEKRVFFSIQDVVRLITFAAAAFFIWAIWQNPITGETNGERLIIVLLKILITLWASGATTVAFLALVRRGYCRLENHRDDGFLQTFFLCTGYSIFCGVALGIFVTGLTATIYYFKPEWPTEDYNLPETAFEIFIFATVIAQIVGVFFGILIGFFEELDAATASRKAAKEAAFAEDEEEAADALGETPAEAPEKAPSN